MDALQIRLPQKHKIFGAPAKTRIDPQNVINRQQPHAAAMESLKTESKHSRGLSCTDRGTSSRAL